MHRCRRGPSSASPRCSVSTAPRRRSRIMANASRAIDCRVLVVALLLSASLSGCGITDTVGDWVGKSKQPLPGARTAVFADRGEIEPDKDMANVEVGLPAPPGNDSWPQAR